MYFIQQISDKQQKEILRLSFMELWVKLQSGQLKAQDALKAYQAKVAPVHVLHFSVLNK